MVLIYTEIEIASPPNRVREVFLDFPKLPEWHSGHFKAIEINSSNNALQKGDTVKVVMEGATFNGVILENSERELTWRGSIWPVFCGDHSYRFEPSKTTPGSTRFIQSENFTGVLSFIMRPLWGYGFGQKTQHGFEKLNKDLKSRMEQHT